MSSRALKRAQADSLITGDNALVSTDDETEEEYEAPVVQRNPFDLLMVCCCYRAVFIMP